MHGLPRSEPARDDGRPAPGDGEQGVDHTLPGDERRRGVETPSGRTLPSHRPAREQRERFVVDPQERLGDGNGIGADLGHDAGSARRNHHPVDQRGCLPGRRDDITHLDRVAGNDRAVERPTTGSIQRRQLDAAPEERAAELVAAFGRQRGEGTLDAVEDVAQQSGPELHIQRCPRVHHRRSDLETTRLLVHLDHGFFRFEPDDLTDESSSPDPHDVVQAGVIEALRDDHGTGDPHHAPGVTVTHAVSPNVMW